MDNINREVRNGTDIDNNILGMDIQPEGNEYKNVKGKIVEMRQTLKNCVERQTELLSTPDKRNVSVSNGIRQSEDISVENGIMGWQNDSKQGSYQRVEMEDKENRRKSTKVIDQQNNNMHDNSRRIATGLGATLIYENQMELKQHDCKSENEAEMANTGSRSLDTFRQHNSSLRYLEMESEGIPDKKNET
ncbi:MAG: hypothetical protein EZS28_049381, partial [Streblomastix strix]